jgi:hypothetical protein
MSSGENREMESWFLRLADAPAGSINAAVDGTTPKVFSLSPDQVGLSYLRISRMLVFIEFGVGSFTSSDYGDISTLANGVRVNYTKGGIVYNLDGTVGITSNAGWARCCYDQIDHSHGTGNQFIVARWTFTEAGDEKKPIVLRGSDTIDVTIQDNLSTLVNHNFFVQGSRP